MRLFFLALALAMLLAPSAANAAESEYGVARVWFNGKEITEQNAMEQLVLKIGEPAEIQLEVTPGTEGNVMYGLVNTMSVYGETPYDIEQGPTKTFLPKKFSEKDYSEDSGNWGAFDAVEGETKTVSWTVIPNGDYKGGGAPFEVYVTVYDKTGHGGAIVFPFFNAYILDEVYPGYAPKTKGTTANPSQVTEGGAGNAGNIYNLGIAILTAAVLVYLWKRK